MLKKNQLSTNLSIIQCFSYTLASRSDSQVISLQWIITVHLHCFTSLSPFFEMLKDTSVTSLNSWVYVNSLNLKEVA